MQCHNTHNTALHCKFYGEIGQDILGARTLQTGAWGRAAVVRSLPAGCGAVPAKQPRPGPQLGGCRELPVGAEGGWWSWAPCETRGLSSGGGVPGGAPGSGDGRPAIPRQ